MIDGVRQSQSVSVRLATDEADAALAVLTMRRTGSSPAAVDLARVFATDGYKRLQTREAAMGRAFTDSAFRAFLLSDTLLRRTAALGRALDAYERMNVRSAAARALRYLPSEATIHATLYLMIKPKTNSFVFDFPDGRAIFIYVDPAKAAHVVEHDVLTHELHHIGYDAACVTSAGDSSPTALARRWLGAFGEGLAMLAAAGGPNVDPHALSAPSERARWRHDFAQWRADLPRVEHFLMDVASGHLTNADSIQAAAATFYGDAQGAWYTVGYAMGTTVERTFGRERLVRAICDPQKLLALYNAAAKVYNRSHRAGDRIPLWSDALLRLLGAP